MPNVTGSVAGDSVPPLELPPAPREFPAASMLGVILFVHGHASLMMPPSRNAIDSELPAWSHGKHPPTDWIQPYACTCTNGTEAECNSGQSCFWFSQGCTIGCPFCDGGPSFLLPLGAEPEEVAPTVRTETTQTKSYPPKTPRWATQFQAFVMMSLCLGGRVVGFPAFAWL